TFIGAEYEKQIAEVTLVDFSSGCGGHAVTVHLAHVDTNNNLVLHLGKHPNVLGFTPDADEPDSFSVSQVKKGDNDGLLVSAFGRDEFHPFQEFFSGQPSGIYAKGGDDNEKVVIDSSVTVPATIECGDGNNTLSYLGSGDANIKVGDGDNKLTYRGQGTGTLKAGNGNNTFVGGLLGTNVFTAAGGDNKMMGSDNPVSPGQVPGTCTFTVDGKGDNTLLGGSGTNTLFVRGGGNNHLAAGHGPTTMKVEGDGNNTFTAGASHD